MMATDEEGRQVALNRYKILATVMGLLAVALFIIGLISATKHPKGGFGPPYFIGGLLVGPLGILHSVICTCVICKAPAVGGDDSIKKRELECAMRGHQILSMFMILACFMGTVLAGIGGFNSGLRDEIDPKAQALAACIIVGCILVLIVNVFGMCILCTYGSYFGINLNQRHGRQVVLFSSNTNNMGGTTFTTTSVPTFGTATGTVPPTMGTNDRVHTLEEQNRLLQQQIQLQQQLLNQQQQMGQMGGGYQPPQYQPQYPPAPPSAPPPSYDKVA